MYGPLNPISKGEIECEATCCINCMKLYDYVRLSAEKSTLFKQKKS